ncbi:putative Queuine tRNA-ribosyltransferase [Leishmania utingensis]|uniref:Queuine tRNA-ribosyltransferase n=1 Tax=Leishmania utingensis TaxID=653362 RepID=A0AAW3ABB5_9TRYP
MDAQAPFLVIPTKRGAVPTLTPAQVNAILDPSERILSTSVFEAIDFVKPCLEAGLPMSAYCGMSGYRTVLTLRSSFHGPHASASSTDSTVAGDSEKGRAVVSFEKWREVVKATQPTLVVVVHESVPLCEPLSKRRRVATTRSEMWLAKTEETSDLGCTILPSISVAGTHDSGYIDAVPRGENSYEFFQTLQALHLSPKKCTMCVAPHIPALLAAMVSNVSLIECPVPWALAEKGVALLLPVKEATGTTPQPVVPLLDLNDNVFALDINPIDEGCGCFTCKRHCRAYLHHLLTVQEMNSDILLVMHNLTQVVRLVRTYRCADAPAREALVSRVASAL